MDTSDFPSLGSDVLDTKSTDEVRKHFNGQHPRFAYEDVAGRGSFGITYRVREKLPNGGGQGGTRRLAVKRALEGEEEVLRNEIRWLKVSEYLHSYPPSLSIFCVYARLLTRSGISGLRAHCPHRGGARRREETRWVCAMGATTVVAGLQGGCPRFAGRAQGARTHDGVLG